MEDERRGRGLERELVLGLAERVNRLIGSNFEEAGRRTGQSAAALYKLAHGQTNEPSLRVVAHVARTYNTTVEWLLWGEAGPEKDFREYPHSRAEQLYRHMMHPASVQAFGDRVSHHDRHSAILAIARAEGYSDEEMAELHSLIATSLRHEVKNGDAES